MVRKRLILTFPARIIDQPITYQLVKHHDLMVNILSARITPREQGRLVIEVSGRRKNLDAGMAFLKEAGVEVQPLAQEVHWHEERCIECTACTSVCPTGALSTSRPIMHVVFDRDKCIACQLCIAVCPYNVLEIDREVV